MDRPRQITHASIATAIQQAADAAKHIAQRNAWRHDVRQFPQRKILDSRVENAGQGRAGEPPVKDQSAMLDHENFGNRLVGELLAPIGRYIKGPRAENGPND